MTKPLSLCNSSGTLCIQKEFLSLRDPGACRRVQAVGSSRVDHNICRLYLLFKITVQEKV